MNRTPKKKNFKALKYGGSSALMVVIFLGILIFVNIFAGYMTERFSLKSDMTEEQIYTVSDEAKKALSAVNEDVNIFILTKESAVQGDDVLKNAVELIGMYNTETGGHIDYQFLDRHTNQYFYEEHPEAAEVNETAIVVKSAKRYMVLDTYDFYDYAQLYNQNTGTYTRLENKKRYQTEEKLVGAILYVTSDKVSNAGFVTGHNELDATMLREIFAANSFAINKGVDLTKEVPSDVNNLVIAVPQVDFSELEMKNLDKYLSKGGNNLYVFIDGYVPQLPVLERYLAEWGLVFSYEAVYDSEKSYYNIAAEKQGEGKYIDGTHVLVVPKGEEFVNESQGDLAIIAPYMRPIKRLWEEESYNRTLEILSTYDSAVAVTTTVVDGSYQQQVSSYGPFTAGAIAEKALGKNGMEGISRIIAFGSSALADSEYMAAAPRAYNYTFLANVVKYANPDQKLIEVEPKIVVNDDLIVYKEDIDKLFWILVVIMPTAILVMGIVVFVRRRRK